MRRKNGWILEDVDGNRFIDAATGWASTPLGAVHEEVTQATVDALWESGIECTDYVTFSHLFPLAEKISADGYAEDAIGAVDLAKRLVG